MQESLGNHVPLEYVLVLYPVVPVHDRAPLEVKSSPRALSQPAGAERFVGRTQPAAWAEFELVWTLARLA